MANNYLDGTANDSRPIRLIDPRAGARGSRRSLREASLLLDAKRVFGSRTLHRSALWPFASTACYSPVLGGERRVGWLR